MIWLILLLVFFVLVAIGCFATADRPQEMNEIDRQLFFGIGIICSLAAILIWFQILFSVVQ